MNQIIRNGDSVVFSSSGPIMLLPPLPVTAIKATGETTINGKKVCIEGDEKKVEISCSYTVPPFMIPGSGKLKIQSLSPEQLTKKTKSGTKSLILKGKLFIAIFEVESPAKQPPPTNAPDPLPFYIVKGEFIANNTKIKAT
ncbi:hypothetical protein FIA58_000155 [Flavobacterium jejuense]|uniref:Uncharacterized protein n=1 Tax=Flavobacterium jejuense TaxID=1544455 RepID=A0ABX0IJS1_9FLAO|nr:hypothetical protein [Flavobacterium jejuense]NHN24074.1 hypothetical protein [Flavobacterium jejuense]